MSTPNTLQARARIPTDTPQRVMNRLCKHFAHKTAVELSDARGRIQFRTNGHAELVITDGVLDITVHAVETDALPQLIGVVERHLAMVEFREAMPVLDWQRSA